MTDVVTVVKEEEIHPATPNGCVQYVDWQPVILNVFSIECCGWFEVCNFYVGKNHLDEDYDITVKKELAELSKNCVFALDGDDNYDTEYTLHCVLTRKQEDVYKETLLGLGWKPWESFRNPNTGNICTPYILVPDSCKV